MAYCKPQRPHAGWTAEETDRLFAAAERAQENGRPLKSVFAEMADMTGRQPNSVRNFYYARMKCSDAPQYAHRRAFTPFTEEEADRLVEQILAAQASGESVRSATRRLAAGDDTVMLRYQNKYRAMLKSDPARVRRIASDMAASGKPAFDPYALSPGVRRVGRPRKRQADIDRMAECVLADLSHVEGLDVRALLDALGALAMAAIRGAAKPGVTHDGDAVASELDALRRQLNAAQERYKVLLGYFTQLTRINREFLSLNSAVKVNALSSYIHDLESNVQSCERIVLEA